MRKIKKIIHFVIGYMSYCKAKRFRAQDERKQKREQWILKKYGYYGGKSYPWSKLYRCKCGNKYPWMHGFPSGPPDNEIVRDGSIYRAVCHRCFRHTKKGTYEEVVEEWNAKHGLNYRKVIAEWEGYPYVEDKPCDKCGHEYNVDRMCIYYTKKELKQELRKREE